MLKEASFIACEGFIGTTATSEIPGNMELHRVQSRFHFKLLGKPIKPTARHPWASLGTWWGHWSPLVHSF